jgi:hypothetical protein
MNPASRAMSDDPHGDRIKALVLLICEYARSMTLEQLDDIIVRFKEYAGLRPKLRLVPPKKKK